MCLSEQPGNSATLSANKQGHLSPGAAGRGASANPWLREELPPILEYMWAPGRAKPPSLQGACASRASCPALPEAPLKTGQQSPPSRRIGRSVKERVSPVDPRAYLHRPDNVISIMAVSAACPVSSMPSSWRPRRLVVVSTPFPG